MKRLGFTLLELLVVVAIISILAAIAVPYLLDAQIRSKVSLARNNQRVLAGGMEAYRVDLNGYPTGQVIPTDPYGVFANSALSSLTTPIAYVGADAFYDPFGQVMSPRQTSSLGGGTASPFDPPLPVVNPAEALLYFYYPQLSSRLRMAALGVDGYALISLAPDRQDSFIVYFPFPSSLPVIAPMFGIHQVNDSVYDPTNGAISEGDLARFGGQVPAPQVVGGGNN